MSITPRVPYPSRAPTWCTFGLFLMCIVGLTGFATAASGPRISLQAFPTQIWLLPADAPPDMPYPTTAELVVRVYSREGQQGDEVLVTFSLAPGWATSASVSPQQMLTRHGIARATFQATQTGVARITVRVGAQTKTIAIAVSLIGSPSAQGE